MTELTSKIASTSPVSETEEAQQSHAMHLGISFNGTQYLYREYKYDRITDAIAYAEHDVMREGRPPAVSSAVEWLDRPVPSAADREQMTLHGISFDGWRYRYRDYRYDRLSDAVSYASGQTR